MKLFYSLIVTFFSFSLVMGQIYEQCLTISGYSEDVYGGANNRLTNASTIRANSSKELVVIGGTKIFRVSKEGIKLWEKTILTRTQDFAIDKDGGAYAIHNSSTSLTKYNSNGTLAWEKNISNAEFSKVLVDDANNVYVVGFDYTLSQLIVTKYSPTGTVTWSKLISNLWNGALTVSSTGEVYVMAADFNIGGYQLIKYSSTGALLWSKVINYNFSNSQIGIGQDGNLYSFLSDDFSTRVIKFNSSNGNNLGETLIDLGRPIFKQGPNNSFFLLGTSNSGTYAIYKIDVNLVATLFKDTGQFFYERDDYKTIDVESDGTVLANVIDSNNAGNKAGYFLRLNPSAVILNSKFFAQVTTGAIIDYQGNYLLPTDNECLKKLILCEKINYSITSQPVNTTVCSGTDAQFVVGVTGLNLSYQWKKGTTLLQNSSKYTGVNTSTLTIKSATPADDAGSYTCEVFDACARNLTSSLVSISFISAPAITLQPVNLSQCPGTDAIFQITTSGGQNVKYQWRKGNVVLVEGATVVGSKTNKLTLKSITAAEVGEYYCDVTSDCYQTPISSQKGVLSIVPPPLISNQPTSVTACIGASAVFTISAIGANISYQWSKGGVNLVESTSSVGTKTNTLTIKDIKSTDTGDYTCVVTGGCGDIVTSSVASLSITPGSQITSQPVSKSACAGTQTTFSISASGTSLVYSWKKGNTLLTNGAKYSGVNTATLTISTITTAEEGSYSCTITNPCGNDLVSNVAQLTIATAPLITAKSGDLNVCTSQIAFMSITASGSGITYQWKKEGVALAEGNGISGTNKSELIIANTKLSDGGNYTCEVASGCGANQTSGIIKLTIQNEASISTQPISTKSCLGDKVSFAVGVAGAVQTYQWKKNGVIITNNVQITGANTATLSIQNLTAADQGLFSCEIKSLCGNTFVSNGVQLDVNTKPDLELLIENCESFTPEWSSLVVDNNNVFGEYLLFEKGKTTPVPDLLSIAKHGLYIIVKTTGVCSDSVEWNNTCVITGIEIDSNTVSVFPNPSQGIFTISHPPIQGLKLFDQKGVEVLSISPDAEDETTVDGSHLSEGLYHIIFYTKSNQVIFHRIIINR